MSDERLCVIAGCRQFGQHLVDCDTDRCKGCRPRHVESGMVCTCDRPLLLSQLQDVSTLFAELVEEPDPVDRAEWTSLQWRPIPTADPVRRQPWLWVSEAGEEPLAKILPMGIVRNGQGAKVTGSKEAPIPVNLDRLDLTAEARPAQLGIVSMPGEDPDQIGHTAVASELDFWAKDWIELRGKGEHLPVPTVAVLVGWLADRLDWACDHHQGVDEFAAKIRRIRKAMRRVLQLDSIARERCEGVYCKGCDRLALFREDGLVTCNYCGLHYSEGEYREWVGLLAGQARRMAA